MLFNILVWSLCICRYIWHMNVHINDCRNITMLHFLIITCTYAYIKHVYNSYTYFLYNAYMQTHNTYVTKFKYTILHIFIYIYNVTQKITNFLHTLYISYISWWICVVNMLITKITRIQYSICVLQKNKKSTKWKKYII